MSSTTKKLITAAKPFKGLFFVAIFSMLLSGFSSILPSWLVKISIDGLAALESGLANFNILPQQIKNYIDPELVNQSFFSIKAENLLTVLPLAIISVAIIDASFKFLYQYNSRKLGLLIVKSLREKYHKHINLMSLAQQRNNDSGSLVSVISSDLQSMQSWLAESMMNMFSESFKALFLFLWLLALDWKLTGLALITIPLFAIPVLKLGKSIRSYAKKGQDYVGSISSFLSETIKNQSIIKAFNLENWRDNKFKQESENLYGLHHQWVLFMAAVSPLTNFIGALGVAAILFFGLNAVKNGTLSVGEFSSFFVTSILLYDPVKRLGRVSTIIQSALGVADRVFALLDQPTQVSEDLLRRSTAKTGASRTVNGDIELKNIDFSYEGNKLFEDLSLRIPAKTSLALVGPSGGGKTSLVSLIPRFYEIDSGEILIDDINISELDLTELRQQIAIVTQEALLFTGTIRENILLGLDPENKLSKKEQDELVNQAAKDSFVSDFATNMDGGLESDIGEAGSKLSIGQKQRISLARAFISKSPIIILDEPTSALDNESQEFIYKSISKLMEDRTVLIIAHRLDTIKNCDRIVYMQGGKILEEGSHDELASQKSAYAELLR